LREANERLRVAQANGASTAASERKSTDGMTALQRLDWLSEAQKTGLLQLVRVPFTTRSGKLSPKFAELFALSPAEVDAMQQALNKAHERLDALALANATTHTTPDGKIVIDVKPFDGGGPIYDEMMDKFASLMGKDRNPAFLQLVDTGQLGDELNQFGAEQRTITMTPAGEKNGQPTYNLLDQHKFAAPAASTPAIGATATPGVTRRSATSGRTVSASGLTADAMNQQIGALSKLVPSAP
jgi:hypothetical protein